MGNYTRSWLNFLFSIIVVIVFAASVFALQLFFDNVAFRLSVLSNLLPTVLGLVVGIPIALWISRKQQHDQEAQENRNRQIEKKAKQDRILRLLKAELSQNRYVLVERMEGQADHGKDYLNVPGVKNDLWVAFSDGGELQWIDDLEILDTISNAHYYIRWIIELEKYYFNPNFRNSTQLMKKDGTYKNTIAGIDTIEKMIELIPQTVKAIDDALAKI